MIFINKNKQVRYLKSLNGFKRGSILLKGTEIDAEKDKNKKDVT